MRKLNRSLATTPTCLSNYSYITDKWEQLVDKTDIWVEIDKFQNKLCVYCEGIAEKGKTSGHIEHFFHKADPKYACLTFVWDNLFGCCSSNKHCGHYKDQKLTGNIKRAYDPNALIKPDVEDPEDFLQFLESGNVKEREGLTEAMKNRALETISALNLDCSELILSREQQIARFKTRLLTLTSVEDISLILQDYQDLYREAMNTFHRTALKQSLPW
jgi:uncharacterized protein (TIGR02646 family)